MPFLPPNQQRQSTEGRNDTGTGQRWTKMTVISVPMARQKLTWISLTYPFLLWLNVDVMFCCWSIARPRSDPAVASTRRPCASAIWQQATPTYTHTHRRTGCKPSASHTHSHWLDSTQIEYRPLSLAVPSDMTTFIWQPHPSLSHTHKHSIQQACFIQHWACDPKGRGFDSLPFQVTTLGKLFTHTHTSPSTIIW